LNTRPPAAPIAADTISSWRASIDRISSGSASQRELDDSMSVNRNVTVPDGSPSTN
jgi:hypothetical protein